MVSGMLAAQAGNVQMQVAATIMKSNADAEKSAVLTLSGAAQQGLDREFLGVGVGLQDRGRDLQLGIPRLGGENTTDHCHHIHTQHPRTRGETLAQGG